MRENLHISTTWERLLKLIGFKSEKEKKEKKKEIRSLRFRMQEERDGLEKYIPSLQRSIFKV